MYREYKTLNQSQIEKDIAEYWEKQRVFQKSIDIREASKPFIFYEGPPSANGLPGIHHVISRTIKDLFCRYKSLKGYKVNRKAGWDTHGLPVELSVEKTLGINKEDIGKKISIEEYNKNCKKEVLKYKDAWEELTSKMAYWVDMSDPYITYEKDYIESVWWALSTLYKKKLLYKSVAIQPYSPKAGTGLSSHELNQPGAYKNVKDTSVVAMFKMQPFSKQKLTADNSKNILHEKMKQYVDNVDNFQPYFLAWTTTPWTLPSNLALTVHPNLQYSFVECFNPYTSDLIVVCLAKELITKYFKTEKKIIDNRVNTEMEKDNWRLLFNVKGKDLQDIQYQQLMPYRQPKKGSPFRIVMGDFVTVQDGTGIVHTAPAFGSDDYMVAKKNNIGIMVLVDNKGKFIDGVGEFSGRYVKNYDDAEDYQDVNVDIAVKLKKEGKAFKVEKYEHSYPHCWRTDKPIMYYPLDSWFIKTSACADRMVELNRTINWKPSSTGTGRFENWLKNLVDWNLSRSRFWGIPLPIWKEVDGKEEKCIGSFEQMKTEFENAKEFNKGKDFNIEDFDPHKPYIDEIYFKSSSGKKMVRESDLIDVWFDSGSMPFAQWHYPFKKKSSFDNVFPADYICEGVDQTRGWFFTLHALSTMLFDSVAYKNVVSNGLVLDKEGNKMSKRLGNAIDPFKAMNDYGADAVRWYLITNASPWDNLKFNLDGILEVKKKFFGTLFNTYQFFAIYANVDKFDYSQKNIYFEQRPDFDKWILSKLHSLIKNVTENLDNYEPTYAFREMEIFLDQDLSNWYVRLSRRKFWKGEMDDDKISAYKTLFECLETISILIAPLAPFFADWLFQNLNQVSKIHQHSSVHLQDFPTSNPIFISKALEHRYSLAQEITSMVLFLRKKENIRVRQPLQKVFFSTVDDEKIKNHFDKIKGIIKNEVNIKEIELCSYEDINLEKNIKPNFQLLGKKLGNKIKPLTSALKNLSQKEISEWQLQRKKVFDLSGKLTAIDFSEVELTLIAPQGRSARSNGKTTVVLDTTITPELESEGYAKELINMMQKVRKERDYNLTDRIKLFLHFENDSVMKKIKSFETLIRQELLATHIEYVIPKEISKHELEILGENGWYQMAL